MQEDTPLVIAERYELTRPISVGGMAQVWHGYDRRLDRPVAVKLIRPDLDPSRQPELIARFIREARVTAGIEHPGVPAVYDADFDTEAGRLYLVIQYLPGHDLSELIYEAERVPLDWALAIAAQVAAVLSHAHEIPVVHRDLKPGNIRIGEAGQIWVLDFGIATMLETDVTRLTHTGNLIGTRAYMAPEQVTNGPITPHTDLYGLGCLLHEMLSGQQVFPADNEFQLMEAHLRQRPVGLRELRPDIPVAVERLVLELLAKRPEDRPGSADEVVARLRPLLPSAGATTTSAPSGFGDPTMPYRIPLAPRGNRDHEPAAGAGRVTADQLDAAIDTAVELLDDERYTQAGDGLKDILDQAARTLGRRHARVLAARKVRSIALFFGGAYQEALPEFLSLAEIFASRHGALNIDALECRQQAAYCQASIGQLAEALAGFTSLLPDLLAGPDELKQAAFGIRRTIAQLYDATGDRCQAVDALESLHRDLTRTFGPDHPDTHQVADLLRRWEATDKAAPPARPVPAADEAWRRVRTEITDDADIATLVLELQGRHAPVPTVGYELGEDAWLAELAWPEHKIAVLLDHGEPGGLRSYHRQGWHARYASQWTVRELFALMKETS